MTDDAPKAAIGQDLRNEQLSGSSNPQGLERSKSQKNRPQAKASSDASNDKRDKRRSRSWHEKKSSQSLSQLFGEQEQDFGGGSQFTTSAPSSAPGSPPITPVSGPSEAHNVDNTVVAAETIPTAIVVKNIPFSLKRDQLLAILNNLDIPRPYAFNYHFDNGVFRGLAFANYRTPEDTDQVVAALNGFEVQGRKLRVEYKRVLPGSQDKAVLTPDVEKEHLDFARVTALTTAASASASALAAVSGGSSSSASSPRDEKKRDLQAGKDPGKKSGPSSSGHSRRESERSMQANGSSQNDALDLNDPDVLRFYDQLILFKGDSTRDEIVYSKSLSSAQRRSVHLIAEKLGLYHYSDGDGDEVQVHVVKKPASAAIMRVDGSQRLNHQRSRSSLHHSSSRDSLRGREDTPTRRVTINTDGLDRSERNAESPSRTGIRRSAITTADSNLIHPSRQPRGPEPGNSNNFGTRTPERRAAVSAASGGSGSGGGGGGGGSGGSGVGGGSAGGSAASATSSSVNGLRRRDSRSSLNLHAPVFQPTTA